MTSCMKAIDRADLVSFDVFDTLLCRLVPHPQDVFFLMGARFQSGLGISPLVFRMTRIRAERILRERSLQTDGHQEVSLSDIHKLLRNDARFEICKNAPRLLDWQAEWDTEKSLIRANPVGRKLLEYALAQNKRVVVTSDTYFEEWQIRELFEIAGLPAPAETFLSCERKRSKRKGDLFDDLLETMDVPPERIAHIGDREDSDVTAPQKRGIRAERLPTIWEIFTTSGLVSVDSSCNNRSVGDLLLLGQLAYTFVEGLMAEDDSWQSDLTMRAGYFSFGPLLLGFSAWLAERLRQRPVQKAMFLAREGQVFLEAFQRLGYAEKLGVETAYLLTSRLAARKACLANGMPAVLFEHFDQIASPYGTRAEPKSGSAPSHYLKGLGFGWTGVDALAKTLDSKCVDSSIHDLLPGLESVIEHGTVYHEYLKDQLPRQGLKAVALIDLGWKGTIPAALRVLIPEEWRVDAYVVSSSAKASHLVYDGFSLSGYLCENGWPPEIPRRIQGNIEVLETVFSSQAGSLWGIRKVNGKFEPVFDPRDEGEQRRVFISKVQKGMQRLLDDMKPLIDLAPGFRILPEIPAAAALRFLNSPSRDEAATLRGITMASVGVDSEFAIEIVPKITVAQILKSPRKQLWRARQCYWNPGYQVCTSFYARHCLSALSSLARRYRGLKQKLKSAKRILRPSAPS